MIAMDRKNRKPVFLSLLTIALVLVLATVLVISYFNFRPTESGGHADSITASTITSTMQQSGGTPNRQVIVDLVTWTSQNGYSSIQWKYITELDVFHVWLDANGSLSYDGNLTNPDITQIIGAAHSRNVKVVLSVGGEGEEPAVINSTLSNSTLRAIVISNIVSQVSAQGYDGVKMDFEGYYNQYQFTVFMHQLYAALHARNGSYIITLNIAPWYQADFNLTALSPYVNNFEIQFNPSLSELQNYSNQVGGRSKVSAGYDLSTQSNFTNLAQNLLNDRNAGYGIFFYSAALMNSTAWDALANAENATAK